MNHRASDRDQQHVPKVLHVVGALNRGGAETWLMEVMRRTTEIAIHIDVCVVTDLVGVYESEVMRFGGRVIRCPLFGNPWSFARRFEKLLARERYDIIHTHIYYFSGLILRSAARVGIPERVAHIHPVADVRPPSISRKIYAHIMRKLIARYGTRFVGPTRASLEGFWGADWERDGNKSVLFNGVCVERFMKHSDRRGVRAELNLPSKAPIIINVARFVPHKRHSFLLEVAKCLELSSRDFYFLLIGNGKLRDDVIRNVKDIALDYRFRFIQGAPCIDRYFLAADAFAFPSIQEGFGIAIAEAGAAGLPVLACDIPGVREAAASCSHVKLLPVDASPAEWAQNLTRLLELPRETDEERLRRLAFFPFTIEASVESLMRLYGVPDSVTAER